MMSQFQLRRAVCLLVAAVCFPLPLHAIDINIDYQYDTNNFFGTGNPDGAVAGAEARASLEAAADFFSGILTDTFSSIETPPPFYSEIFDGSVTWSWSMSFSNPQSGSAMTLFDETIAADEYQIFVGARSLPGSTLGSGGPGGFVWSSTPNGGLFTQEELDQINQISADFSDAVDNREETSGFARWGGAITFDNDASTNWHYDHTSSPAAGENDFLSVVIHELGHSLGLGIADDWNALVSAGSFIGTASVSEHGGAVPLDCGGSCGHWADGTSSDILGTSAAQEAAMDPSLLQGTRKRLTVLDAAGLTDIGWSVVSPTFDPADYDFDGDVDADDLATFKTWFGINGNGDADGDSDTDGQDFLVWQRNYTGPFPFSSLSAVPEPSTLALCASAMLFCLRRRHTGS